MSTEKAITNTKKNENGAALITVLMISLILLVASTGLLLESGLNAANVTDAIAEEQAYTAAESGIQSTLNVLRGNSPPISLLDTSAPATSTTNLINYRRALKMSSSNLSTDTSTTPRLSRWLSYDSTYPDRVVLGSNYNSRNGFAYSLLLSDPDTTNDFLVYSTTGKINGSTGTYTLQQNNSNYISITYYPKSSTTLDVSGDTASTNLGTFYIDTRGSYTITQDIPFTINLNMTDPYVVTKVIRGSIQLPRDPTTLAPISTTVTATSLGNLKIFFDSPVYQNMGSTITMLNGSISSVPNGYLLTPVIGANVTDCTMTSTEPVRLKVLATGYGPRGSKKQLEAIVQKNFFNGMTAPATLTMVGSSSSFVFAPGESQNVTYSGDDVVSTLNIPPVGTTDDTNLATIVTQFATIGRKADVYGSPANVSDELPTWLKSPGNLDAVIKSLKNVAIAEGEYYNGTSPTSIGDNLTAKGLTFVEGDYSLTGAGGGILVCTGKLTLNGDFNFNGLIIVTGSGGVARNGGGTGIVQGNMVIAPYDASNTSLPFLSPKYDMSGGGNSAITFNSSSLGNGMAAVSNFILGVAEK
jgi:hypothetical protein